MSSLQDNLDQGRRKLERGDYPGALALADAVLAQDNASVAALQLRSRALFLLGQDNEALQTLRRAHAVLQTLLPGVLDFDAFPEFEQTSDLEIFAGESGVETLETLIALRERHSLDAELLDLLAALAEDAGRLEIARSAYYELVAIDASRLDAWEGLVHVLCHGDLDAALETLTRAQGLFPAHALFFEFLGFIYFRRRKFQQAIRAYRQAISLGAEHAENYQALVECYLALEEDETALELLQQLAHYGANDVDTHCFIIEVALQCRQLDLAISHAHQLVRLQPSHAETYCYKAWGEIATGDWPSAERTLRLGFHKAVDGAFALFELVEMLLADEDTDHALQVVRLAIELAPHHPESSAARGKVLREIGRLDEAFEAFREAATLAPHDDTYRTWMGVVLDNMGDYSQAMQHFDDVLSRMPSDVWTLSNRGLCYLALNDPQQALLDFRRGIDIDPEDAPLFFWCACALVKLGQHDQAFRELRRAVDLSEEMFAWLAEEPILLPLHNDPRFRALLDTSEDAK